MRRASAHRSARAPSPTGTSYSGISNYKNDSYRTLVNNSPMPLPGSDAKSIARTHFEELHRYLASYLAKGVSSPLLCCVAHTPMPELFALRAPDDVFKSLPTPVLPPARSLRD